MAARSREIVIIGAGPAGIAAAVQLRRQGHNPLVFEMDEPGGLLRNAGWVENYPGFPDGISGEELASLFTRQLKRWDVEVVKQKVTSLSIDNGCFTVATNDGCVSARVAVIASGTKANTLDDLDPTGSARDRILYEVHPLIHKTNKTIAIIGGGDAAFDYALTLSKHNEVTIFNRTSVARCLPLLKERVQAEGLITYKDNVSVKYPIRVSNDKLVLDCESDGNSFDFTADYLILAIGRKPHLDFLSEDVIARMDELKKSGCLYLIGDVVNDRFRQTAIAVGEGVKAAMRIDRMIGDSVK
ncbi:MAG: NAD(P)/FAD-dependent oxidoreductase [Candidatus Zixiibacteriota bacterium]